MAKTKTSTETKTQAQAQQQLEGYPVELIDLKKVVSNEGQTRGMGVIANLNALGYGLFERTTAAESEPVWQMLLSDDESQRTQAAALVTEHEPKILVLWQSIKERGQLQPAGVTYYEDGGVNVVFGMRRAIACALGYAMGEGQATFQARILPTGLSQLEYETLGRTENDDREDESPIDKAMIFQRWKKEEKIIAKEIAARIGRSEQHVLDHLALLDKRLEPHRIAIHNREMPIAKALAKLKELKGGTNEVEKGDGDKQRPRFPGYKKIERILGGYRPPEMKDKEWGFWVDPKVRDFLSYVLNIKIKPLTEEQAAGKVKDVRKRGAESNGTNGQQGFPVSTGRKVANNLLIALGKTNAATWDDAKVKTTLESIVNLAGPGTQVEGGGKPQELLDALLDNYDKGLVVTVKPLKETAAAGKK